MNESKKMMQAGASAGGYLAPSVEVTRIEPWRVICASEGFEGDYTETGPEEEGL